MLKTGHLPTVITSKAIEVCVSAERGEYNEQYTPLHLTLNKPRPHTGFTDITLQL